MSEKLLAPSIIYIPEGVTVEYLYRFPKTILQECTAAELEKLAGKRVSARVGIPLDREIVRMAYLQALSV